VPLRMVRRHIPPRILHLPLAVSRSSQPRHNPDRPRAPARHRAGDYDPSGQLACCPNVLSLTSSLRVWYCYLAKIGDRAEAAGARFFRSS
jgi:hypothetical protein